MPDLGTDRLGAAGDLFYEALIRAHEGLNDEESARLNARLVLILANQAISTRCGRRWRRHGPA